MDPSTDGGSSRNREQAEPGEPRRHLDRPPGERFTGDPGEAAATPAGPGLSPSAAAVRAVATAAIGAALITVLGGPLSITAGLVAVAAVTGWAVGSFVQPRVALAAAIAVASVAVGLVGVWLYARSEGGVLDPISYVAEVHGPLVVLELAAAAVAAWLGARSGRA